MTLSEKTSNHNFYAFLWHAAFLTFAQNFTDIDTIIPAMLVEAGGGPVHIGIMSAIMMGGAAFSQLFFAPSISNRPYKKGPLLIGINSRILSLFALGTMFLYTSIFPAGYLLWAIFFFITIFSLGGAFANISYFDIIGKAISENRRITFFSTRQAIAGIILLFSSLLAKKVLVLNSFPTNYAMMFLIGGAALLTASLGFWSLKEHEATVLKIEGVADFFHVMAKELRENNKLLYFLGLINVQGIALSFLPFVILYAKRSFQTQSGETGTFLLYKVAGLVIVGLLVLLAAKKIRYRPLLYVNAALSVLLALITAVAESALTLRMIFFLGGVIYSLHSITMNGLFLELSAHHNRAIYTGFLGAGNILPMIFPFAGGWIIREFGFRPFFLLFALIVSSSFYFIARMMPSSRVGIGTAK
jgi:MFS family permease